MIVNHYCSLPDISKWDVRNVKTMSYLFYNCKCLKSLPDISVWNIQSINDLTGIFNRCSSLKSIPDISDWNVKNICYRKVLINEDWLK